MAGYRIHGFGESSETAEQSQIPLETNKMTYDILGVVEGTKPALAAHATDDKAFFVLPRKGR